MHFKRLTRMSPAFFTTLQDQDGEAQFVTRVGRLVIVDLAGNERLEARGI